MYTSSRETMVKLIPLVQDLEAWKHHFSEMSKGNQHGQYVVKGLGTKTEQKNPDIKMVSPTEAAVDPEKKEKKRGPTK